MEITTPHCSRCGNSDPKRFQFRGKVFDGGTTKRFVCKKCGKWGTTKQQNISRHPRPCRILLLDIETLPGEYYAFDPHVEYLSPDKKIKSWSISCWAAKWLDSSEIMGESVTPQQAFDRDDRNVLDTIWKLIDESNIVVTQNGINFDLKKLMSKFLENRMGNPSPYQNVDTLKVAKETFGEDYNRLDELGKKLGIGEKIEMSFVDWKKCLTNDDNAQIALDQMLTYCKHDIAPLLEDVYLTMLPYMKSHPNVGVYADNVRDVCPRCGSVDLRWTSQYATPQGLWMAARCGSCGSISRGKGKNNKIRSVTVA